MTVAAPLPLAAHHDTAACACGVASLDTWLKHRALKNRITGASRTFVACEGAAVMAYYSLASSAVTVEEAPGRFRRNMLDPIPVVVLGRLAVHQSLQGTGVGRALRRDACYRLMHAAEQHRYSGNDRPRTLGPDATAFYERLGFDPSPLDPMTLMITLADLRASL